MLDISTAPKHVARATAYLGARFLFGSINPTIPDNGTERLVRKLGFFHAPTPAEVVAYYLRGFVLFGRANPFGTWFYWYWVPSRAVITRDTANVPRNLQRLQRQGAFEVRCDQDVEAIMHCCRQGRDGWLTPHVAEVYLNMFRSGLIGTVGVYREGKLVGGLWGLTIGEIFAIMSMFHLENNAGALAFATLAHAVASGGRWQIVDCGVPNRHWERFGTLNIPVEQFSRLVTMNLIENSRKEKTPVPIPELNRELS